MRSFSFTGVFVLQKLLEMDEIEGVPAIERK